MFRRAKLALTSVTGSSSSSLFAHAVCSARAGFPVPCSPAVACALALSATGYMLRSVVSATAANMMLVRCNSGVPISLACSPELAAPVRATASPEPRPSGHSEARARRQVAGGATKRSGHGRRHVWPEIRAIAPHPMENDSDPAGQGYHRPLVSAPFCNPRRPCSQP